MRLVLEIQDPLLAEIVATPDDDAPRLVWADREGGERGELVVLQCAIAREDFQTRYARPERARFLRRAERLVRQHGTAWAGVADFGRAEFERGFPKWVSSHDVVSLRGRERELLSRAPTLRTIAFQRMCAGTNRFSGPTMLEDWNTTADALTAIFETFVDIASTRSGAPRVDGIEGSPTTYMEGDWSETGTTQSFGLQFIELLAKRARGVAEQLRSLAIPAVETPADAIPELRAFVNLEHLYLEAHAFTPADLMMIVRDHPKLKELVLLANDARETEDTFMGFLEEPALAQLTQLDLTDSRFRYAHFEYVARCPHLTGLKHLGLRDASVSWRSVREIASSPYLARVRDLDLSSSLDDEGFRALAESPMATRLRTLDLWSPNLTTKSQSLLLSAFPNLDSVGLDNSKNAFDVALLEREIPIVRT